jgi:tetratricopeptide (TPR) repeat protein
MSLDRAMALQAAAWRLQQQWRLADAAAALAAAIAACGDQAPLDVANLLNDLADVEAQRGDFCRSLDLAQRALRLGPADAGAGGDETVARIRCRSLELSAAAARTQGVYREAERALEEALGLATAVFGAASFDVAQLNNSLGMVYKYWGRWDDARRLYDLVLQAVRASDGDDSDAAASVYHNLGGLLHAAGDYAQAEAPARRAWDIARARHGDDDLETMRHAAACAAILDGQGRHDESVAIYRRALAVHERVCGPHHPEVAGTCHNLGAALAAQGALVEAARQYRRALAIHERTIGPEAPEAALTRQQLGRVLCAIGRADEGRRLLRVARRALAARLPASHPFRTALAAETPGRAHRSPAPGRTVARRTGTAPHRRGPAPRARPRRRQ